MKIAFIGLGIMGSEMANNLAKSGVVVHAFNRTAKNAEDFHENVQLMASAEDAVEGADVVYSMLSKPEVVKPLFYGKKGLLSKMKNNSLWVDCSTVNPSFSKQSEHKAEIHNVRFIDAPVAGSKPQATNAELVFFLGGNASDIETVKPHLTAMGKKQMHVGECGQGAALKMLVNMLLAQSMLMFSEAILLGQKMGINKAFLLDTLPNLVVTAPFTKFKAESIRNDDYQVQFPLEWMHKDLHLATLTAYELNQPLFLANLTKEVFAKAKAAGLSRLDFSAVHKFLEESH